MKVLNNRFLDIDFDILINNCGGLYYGCGFELMYFDFLGADLSHDRDNLVKMRWLLYLTLIRKKAKKKARLMAMDTRGPDLTQTSDYADL